MGAELLSLILFSLGIAAYSISQKAQHGQLRWSDPKKPYGFWGAHSDKRKYKMIVGSWSEKPAFFLSTTWLVFLTDGYHFCQMLAGLFISLSFAPILGLTWSVIFWGVAHLIHWAVYRHLQK